MRRKFILFFVIFSCFFVFPSVRAETRLDYYIIKNHEKKVYNKGCLNEIDKLVNYFTSYDFFEEGVTLNPNFVKALVLAESGCTKKAVSSKGAVGLGQLMLSTAQEEANNILLLQHDFKYIEEQELTQLTKEDLFKPEINLLLTVFLLSKYNYIYDGRLDLIVSAWNAGQGAIKKEVPPPYPETLNLIGRVNAYYKQLEKESIKSIVFNDEQSYLK